MVAPENVLGSRDIVDAVFELPGGHRLVAIGSAKLRWGRDLPRPDAKAPRERIFEDLNLERLIRELQSR